MAEITEAQRAAIAAAAALTANPPVNVTKAAAAVGVGTTAARDDHKHDVSTAAASGSADIGDTGTEGSASSLARSDHVHPFPAPGAGYPLDVADAEADGTATTPARSDHVHKMGIITTKGDILGFSTLPIRRAVGSDGQALTADSAQADGLKYMVPTIYTFPAEMLVSPVNADWAVNAFAPVGADTLNAALTTRSYDDTTEEGAGTPPLFMPLNSKGFKLRIKSRAQTAPGATRTVGFKVYVRGLLDNLTPAAWQSLVLNDISIPTNAFFQDDSQDILFSAFGTPLVAGSYYQFEYTRINPAAGTELVGDWNLLHLQMEMQ